MDLQKKWDGVWKMKFIQQYKNLSKEIYILFFGRVVTSMGSLIWPLLTLIDPSLPSHETLQKQQPLAE